MGELPLGCEQMTIYGRPRIYKDRVHENITLPREAVEKAHELRGQTPMTMFLGRIVCNALCVDGIATGDEKRNA